MMACCNKRVLEVQPDFQQQKSYIQEVIENAGHLCIFLPKFHCELNFIEWFWGKVKKYLQDNCDGTFNTLKTNMPSAMQSVTVCAAQYHSTVGTSYVPLDGSISHGPGHKGCTISGPPIQFNEIQDTDVSRRCWHAYLTDRQVVILCVAKLTPHEKYISPKFNSIKNSSCRIIVLIKRIISTRGNKNLIFFEGAGNLAQK